MKIHRFNRNENFSLDAIGLQIRLEKQGLKPRDTLSVFVMKSQVANSSRKTRIETFLFIYAFESNFQVANSSRKTRIET